MDGLVRTDPVRPPAANDDGAPSTAVGEVIRRFDITPAEVFQREPPGPPPAWAERSFAAPVLLVIAISAALLYGTIAVAVALWSWLH